MLTRLLVVVAIVALAALVGVVHRRRSGRVRSGDGRFTASQLAAVGLDASGAEAVALLMGSPTCSPCVTVKAILGEVAAERPRFRWAYVDAADHLGIADLHRVMRVPTLFVLDPRGRILARTSGVPAKRDVIAVLDREGTLEAA